MNNNSNFLNLHVLFTTAFANPNRDDTGAPKSVTYGAATRQRMSSQAMTRTKRVMFETETGGDQITWRAKSGMIDLALRQATDLAAQTGNPLTPTEITALQQKLSVAVNSLVVNREKALKAVEEKAKTKAKADAKRTADALLNGEVPDPTDDTDEDPGNDTGKKDTLVWLAEHEVATLVMKALTALREGTEPGDFVNKTGRTQSLSIAAFGRMFAFRPDLQNEAAVQRAHAFTTHTSDVEPDYFTAVDDLQNIENGKGAGHLAFNQFSGGVFYWHCNIDRRQLWATWIAGDNQAAIRARLTAFFGALLTALPDGKAATTAYKTVPDAVLMVSASSPVALHQSFETPVTAGPDGYRTRSVDALLRTHARTVAFTPKMFDPDAVLATTLDPTADLAGLTVAPSLDELITRCVDWVLAGRPTLTDPVE